MNTEIGIKLEKAIDFLNEGALVAIPTETVYGLAGNAFSKESILQIFEVKNRPHFDPLIVHTHSIDGLLPLVTHIPEKAKLLLKAFAPGPLTLLLPKSDLISDLVTAGSPLVAVRIPGHALTLELLKNLAFPLAAPSANPFGYISPTTAEHVKAQLGGKIPYILDGGNAMVGVESTIVGFEGEETVIYRMGGTPIEAIIELIGPVRFQTSSSNPQAPGQLKSHYAPKKPFLVGDIKELIQNYAPHEIAVLSFNSFFDSIPQSQQIQLAPDGKLSSAAFNLFDAMRKLDGLSVKCILSEFVPNIGLGAAINDRLLRASVKS